ncbi:hypothetical protein [Candidatus Thiothrix anitrata]|uniref:Transposase n=2 Tax=Candidatus Thiothrix anitrata TaxID=2823902 RepID=A0ABX7X410_9GAMM|nr:hypothetical protein [Candidatus Thiothrix anitrata]QTR50027.1 hypothetical protein J8380_00065 [Candidatus Thiothrix anitrata]
MGIFQSFQPLLQSETHEKNPPAKQRSRLSPRQASKIKQRDVSAQKRVIAAQQRKKTALVYEMHRTIFQHFPHLLDWMRQVDDRRKKASDYELAAHLTACLALFLFKSESRNQYNHYRGDAQFAENYQRLFGFAMPHGDSVHNVMAQFNEDQIEHLKHQMVQVLLRRKTFHGSRYRGKWFLVAVDASGVGSYAHQRDAQCLHRTSKTGKITYFHTVLEARLVTAGGFSVSIASQWIENPEGTDYDKQDCERKAFTRLATKLKQIYPRLPIMILADGLYPYEGFFNTCKANGWAYCVTFKDGNLPSVWEEVRSLMPLQGANTHQEIRHQPSGATTQQAFRWVEGVDYQGHTLQWLECRETFTPKATADNTSAPSSKITHFVHLTDLPVNWRNIAATSHSGRLRWKIENEGFNTLKNQDYGMKHQYARKSYRALKNYFQFMQMAHLIHQLMTLTTRFKESFLSGQNHPTLKNLWRDLIAAMQWGELDTQELEHVAGTCAQFRFST